MKIKVYPADVFGCGHFRLIWACEFLMAAGHDIELVPPGERQLELRVSGNEVTDVVLGDEDVIVFQRVTHAFLAQAVPIIRAKGVAVVVDIDDDLSAIHPSNPAYAAMHPRNEMRLEPGRREPRRHSWHHLATACREATLVTTSTPGLIERYARHGRGQVIYNYLPEIYYGVPHEDSDLIGWPAALVSHPDDPSAVGGALARLTGAGAAFQVVGDPTGAGRAFGLSEDPQGILGVDVHQWPAEVARLGIGIAPLADTKFNRSKSWLKPLEMSALGVPWVASPSAEYARLHRMGVGVLADRPRQWYRHLDLIRRDAGLRNDLAGQGYEVAAGLRLRDHAWRWAEAWSNALELQRGSVGAGVQ